MGATRSPTGRRRSVATACLAGPPPWGASRSDALKHGLEPASVPTIEHSALCECLNHQQVNIERPFRTTEVDETAFCAAMKNVLVTVVVALCGQRRGTRHSSLWLLATVVATLSKQAKRVGNNTRHGKHARHGRRLITGLRQYLLLASSCRRFAGIGGTGLLR